MPFGRAMLSLRTRLGLTQAGLAERLRISRHAVGEWESGSSYPKAPHLQHVLVLAVQQHVFAPEREEEEIRAFWKVAHQKVLLDETWLHKLLSSAHPEPIVPANGATDDSSSDLLHRVTTIDSAPTTSFPRMDWIGALDVSRFTGREGELAELAHWMVHERCRMVAVLGMGGIGKSALVSMVGHQFTKHFDAVLWRSLRDAPSCEELVADCLTFCSSLHL